MAKKGQLTKAEYIPMDEFKGIVRRLEKDENWKFELYFTFSCATALRVIDVMNTRWSEIFDKDRLGNITMKKVFVKEEIKTGKIRKIRFSQSVADRIIYLYTLLGSPDIDRFIFTNRWGKKSWSSQYLNAELKRIRDRYDVSITNFSTHTFRKTFARGYWDAQGRTSESLILLMDILNHSSIAMTKKYLGITDDEIAEVYMNFEL